MGIFDPCLGQPHVPRACTFTCKSASESKLSVYQRTSLSPHTSINSTTIINDVAVISATLSLAPLVHLTLEPHTDVKPCFRRHFGSVAACVCSPTFIMYPNMGEYVQVEADLGDNAN